MQDSYCDLEHFEFNPSEIKKIRDTIFSLLEKEGNFPNEKRNLPNSNFKGTEISDFSVLDFGKISNGKGNFLFYFK